MRARHCVIGMWARALLLVCGLDTVIGMRARHCVIGMWAR